MKLVISLLNYGAVCLFGCVLSFAFCGLGKKKKEAISAVAIIVVLILAQGISFFLLGKEMTFYLYPLLIHLPLTLFLWVVGRQPFLWSAAAVLTAYLCCQPRKWLGAVALIFTSDKTISYLVEFLITFPLLWYFVVYVAPSVRKMRAGERQDCFRFFILPVLFYLFDYLTVVYTDWLYSGITVVVEFMPSLCCIFYLLFLVRYSSAQEQRRQLERDCSNLNLQVTQSIREVTALRQSQQQLSACRHDLRHHLRYLSACIENGRLEEAQNYIRAVDREIEAQKVIPFCENEPANLILSAYAERAAAGKIETKFKAILPDELRISHTDLCVVLSNALENAVHACDEVEEGKRYIRLSASEKNGMLFLSVENSCARACAFADGMPVAAPGHGVGTRSIKMIVERYGGMCSFSVGESSFLLRAVINAC